jgi:hypothetical protein
VELGHNKWSARIIFLVVLFSAGGAAFYATDSLRRRGGRRKIAANVLSALAYCIAVVAAFVLGMDGPD